MSNLSQFSGGRGAPRPTAALNGTSAFRQVSAISNRPLFNYSTTVKTVLSGATTADVLKTILSLSGSGVVSFLAVESVDATSRTHRLKVTLDGVVIFDATTGAIASTSAMLVAIGALSQVAASAPSIVTFEPMAFVSSLVIEYADSLSETDGATIGYRYYAT